MICGIEFVGWVEKLGKGVNELIFWWFWHATEEQEKYPNVSAIMHETNKAGQNWLFSRHF